MQTIWETAKQAIKAQIPPHSYRMWIEPLECEQADGETVVLFCPNIFFKKRLQENYHELLRSELARAGNRSCRISLKVHSKTAHPTPKQSKPRRRVNGEGELKAQPQLGLPESGPANFSGRLLRKDFTFDRFVVGTNNDFAYSAALSLASGRSFNQNSLFLMSQPGMGKSHLSQAIGHHILSCFPRDRVYYITAEDFTNEMVQGFRNGDIETFKAKYRNGCDVLLLEDVHFLTGKERTQLELALALDYLLNADKKLIFTSCFSPTEIPRLNDQLRSRLSSALISHIEAPDYFTRVKILEEKLKIRGLKMPREVTDFLASELSENVRQLESGLIGVTARSALLRQPVTLNLAQNVIKDIVQPGSKKKAITVERIQEIVGTHYNITVADMVSRSRKKAIVRPRQVAIYLARKYTDSPLQFISKRFNRYHATAIHSINAVEKQAKTDISLRKQLEFLCEKIESEGRR